MMTDMLTMATVSLFGTHGARGPMNDMFLYTVRGGLSASAKKTMARLLTSEIVKL